MEMLLDQPFAPVHMKVMVHVLRYFNGDPRYISQHFLCPFFSSMSLSFTVLHESIIEVGDLLRHVVHKMELVVCAVSTAIGCMQVECWRQRVSNATELDSLIQRYPVLLSYSFGMSVSRLDYLTQVQTSSFT